MFVKHHVATYDETQPPIKNYSDKLKMSLIFFPLKKEKNPTLFLKYKIHLFFPTEFSSFIEMNFKELTISHAPFLSYFSFWLSEEYYNYLSSRKIYQAPLQKTQKTLSLNTRKLHCLFQGTHWSKQMSENNFPSYWVLLPVWPDAVCCLPFLFLKHLLAVTARNVIMTMVDQ